MILMLFFNQFVGDVMIPIRTLLKLLLIGLVSWPSIDGQVVSDEPRANFKVISYNVQFLPGLAAVANNRADAPYRAHRLGELLAAWDVVGLNEVFDNTARKQILDGLKTTWGKAYAAVTGPQSVDPKRFNGGLAIATHLPIIEHHSTIYTRYSRREEFGLRADGFAAKGVLHARISRSEGSPIDDFIDVFVTHMEARDDSLRPFQYQEIAAFILRYADSGHPTLIMGDFNTRGDPKYRNDPKSQYNLLIKELTAAMPGKELRDLWPSIHGDALGGTNEQGSSDIGHRIDYVMLAVPVVSASRVRPIAVRVNPFLDDKVSALSDHSAVEADLYWPLTQ